MDTKQCKVGPRENVILEQLVVPDPFTTPPTDSDAWVILASFRQGELTTDISVLPGRKNISDVYLIAGLSCAYGLIADKYPDLSAIPFKLGKLIVDRLNQISGGKGSCLYTKCLNESILRRLWLSKLTNGTRLQVERPLDPKYSGIKAPGYLRAILTSDELPGIPGGQALKIGTTDIRVRSPGEPLKLKDLELQISRLIPAEELEKVIYALRAPAQRMEWLSKKEAVLQPERPATCPPGLRAQNLYRRGLVLFLHHKSPEANGVLRRAVQSARQVGTPEATALAAQIAMAWRASARGDARGTVDAQQELDHALSELIQQKRDDLVEKFLAEITERIAIVKASARPAAADPVTASAPSAIIEAQAELACEQLRKARPFRGPRDDEIGSILRGLQPRFHYAVEHDEWTDRSSETHDECVALLDPSDAEISRHASARGLEAFALTLDRLGEDRRLLADWLASTAEWGAREAMKSWLYAELRMRGIPRADLNENLTPEQSKPFRVHGSPVWFAIFREALCGPEAYTTTWGPKLSHGLDDLVRKLNEPDRCTRLFTSLEHIVEDIRARAQPYKLTAQELDGAHVTFNDAMYCVACLCADLSPLALELLEEAARSRLNRELDLDVGFVNTCQRWA